jgi:uncharacterized protein DUF4412
MAHSGRLLCLALVASSYAAPILAQPAGFEGTVAYRLTGSGRGAEMTQMYKGMKSRTEIGAGGQSSAMIMDLTTGVMTVLMPQQKAYMVMDMRKAGQAAAGLPFIKDKMARGGAPPSMPKVSATGRTEVVAGHTCEYYVMGEKGEAEVCSAKGLGMFMFGQSPMGGAAAGSMALLGAMSGSPDYLKLFKDGFFPLKMVHGEGGKKEVVMEATRVEKKALDPSLFVPPPDYKEMKMPGFGR